MLALASYLAYGHKSGSVSTLSSDVTLCKKANKHIFQKSKTEVLCLHVTHTANHELFCFLLLLNISSVWTLQLGLLSLSRCSSCVFYVHYYVKYCIVAIFFINANSGKDAHVCAHVYIHVVLILLCQHTGHRWQTLL